MKVGRRNTKFYWNEKDERNTKHRNKRRKKKREIM